MGGLSSKPRLYVPDEKAQRTYALLKLKDSEIDKLYEVFTYVDRDGSGEISLREFFSFLEIKKTLFAEKAFSIMDEDQSGEIDFREFVVAIWNYCSFTRSALVLFAFDLYDIDNSGTIGLDEVQLICREVYGDQFQANTLAKKVFEQLSELSKKCGNNISAESFQNFCRSHPGLLFPAFGLQMELQGKIMGQKFWKVISKRRGGTREAEMSWRVLYNQINNMGGDEGVDMSAVDKDTKEALMALEAGTTEKDVVVYGTLAARRIAAEQDKRDEVEREGRVHRAAQERDWMEEHIRLEEDHVKELILQQERIRRRGLRRARAVEAGIDLPEGDSAISSEEEEEDEEKKSSNNGGLSRGHSMRSSLNRGVDSRRGSSHSSASGSHSQSGSVGSVVSGGKVRLGHTSRRRTARRESLRSAMSESSRHSSRRLVGWDLTSNHSSGIIGGGGLMGASAVGLPWEFDVPQRVTRRAKHEYKTSIKLTEDPHMELFL